MLAPVQTEKVKTISVQFKVRFEREQCGYFNRCLLIF